MKHPERQKRSIWTSWQMCLALSLCLHLLLFFVWQHESSTHTPRPQQRIVQVQLERNKVKEKPLQPSESPQVQEKKEPTFAKTRSEDASPYPVIKPDYIGAHRTQGQGESTPTGEKNIPTMSGEKPRTKTDIVFFDQEKQEGPLEHDGRKNTPQTPPSPPATPETKAVASLNTQNQPNLTPSPTDKAVKGQKTGSDEGDPTQQATTELAKKDGEIHDKTPTENAPEDLSSFVPKPKRRDSMPNNRSVPTPHNTIPQPLLSLKELQLPTELNLPQIPKLPQQPSPKRKVAVYDPAFPADAQPGFRTRERKTRASGRFVMGEKARMNVDASPTGRYEAWVYRAIAMHWYKQCDENRDFIVPGSLRIRLVVNTKGQISSMTQLTQQGASATQRSFTFLSIRQAPIPPMPAEVIQDLVGDTLELIFDFHFD